MLLTSTVIALSCWAIYALYKRRSRPATVDPRGKYVLISGCDTGFGNSLAIALDQLGFHVVAGVFDTNNTKTLADRLSSRATVIGLDITSTASIDAALALVQNSTASLHALVNNAGIADGGLIDWVSLSSIRQVMDVNFFGHVAMTKTFLPLLLAEPNGRVVNMSSTAGYLAAAGAASYSASKFALEGFSDCLRREMAVWDLHVSIIEPGFMRTPIVDSIAEKMRTVWTDRTDETVRRRWGEAFFHDWFTEGTKLASQTADDPTKVVRAMCHAVSSVRPSIRYRPGWQSSLFCFPLSMAPASIVDRLIALGQRKMALPHAVLVRNQRH